MPIKQARINVITNVGLDFFLQILTNRMIMPITVSMPAMKTMWKKLIAPMYLVVLRFCSVLMKR